MLGHDYLEDAEKQSDGKFGFSTSEKEKKPFPIQKAGRCTSRGMGDIKITTGVQIGHSNLDSFVSNKGKRETALIEVGVTCQRKR